MDAITGFLFGTVPWFAWLVPVVPLLLLADRFVPAPFNKWTNVAIVAGAVAMGLYGKGSNDTEARWQRKNQEDKDRLRIELQAEATAEALRANKAEEYNRELRTQIEGLVRQYDGKGNVPRRLIDQLNGL